MDVLLGDDDHVCSATHRSGNSDGGAFSVNSSGRDTFSEADSLSTWPRLTGLVNRVVKYVARRRMLTRLRRILLSRMSETS